MAKIMQITTAVPIFLRCLKCSDRQDGCAWVAAQPENKNLGGKKGSVLAAETPCLAVGSWLALTPRPRFSEGGLKAASRRSANPVSLPSLRQPHSFHRTLSNEHFRFIKGSFGNIFSSVKKKQTKQATKWELMWTPRCRLQRRGGSSSLQLGRILLFKYSYPFSTAPLSASHSYTSLSQHGSSSSQTPPGHVLVSVIGSCGCASSWIRLGISHRPLP